MNSFRSINSVSGSVSAFSFLSGHAASVEFPEPVADSFAAARADQLYPVRRDYSNPLRPGTNGQPVSDTDLATSRGAPVRLRPCLQTGLRLPDCQQRSLALEHLGWQAPAGPASALATPVVDVLRHDQRVSGDLSHPLAVRRAHAQANCYPQSAVIWRLNCRRLGPPEDGLDRPDNFPDSGGRNARCNKM